LKPLPSKATDGGMEGNGSGPKSLLQTEPMSVGAAFAATHRGIEDAGFGAEAPV